MIEADQIREILPHRYPMLLVDQVLELEPASRLVARKAVSCNEPWYNALADGTGLSRYAYPSVLLVESWCQSAGILAACDKPNPDVLDGQVMLFGSMSNIKFGRDVLPGEVLEHRVRIVRDLGDTLIFEGETVVGEDTVLQVGWVVMAMRPATELRPPE